MNFSRQQDQQYEFQMAPMIDIIFLLLVFFIVSYSMGEIEREMAVTLPTASTSQDPISRINDIVINITKDGKIIVNKRQLSSNALYERLKKLSNFGAPPSVIIRADENCLHKNVIKVMNACTKADAKNIVFSTAGNTDEK